jgi:two-component system, OmpR family, KDP operon response regulator KdpE
MIYSVSSMETKKRILVVDDEPGILRFIKIGLSLAGYDVITATNGEEGLKLADSAKPDLMLLDILMVPMSGFEVLVKLREFSNMPVIVFTARNDIGDKAIKEGANAFISKPFAPEQLVRKIEDTLDSHNAKA